MEAKKLSTARPIAAEMRLSDHHDPCFGMVWSVSEPTLPNRRREIETEARALLRLAFPVVLAQLGMMLLGVVDTMMVGRIDESAMAAVGTGHTFSFAFMIIGIGMLLVLDPFISQAYGAREHGRVSESFWRGGVLALVLSVVTAIPIVFGEPLMRVLSGDSEVVPIAYRYALWLVPSLPAYFLYSVVRQTMQAMSVVRPVVISVIVGNVANVLGNWAFIFGKLGAPELGAPGSAVSTTICRYVMLATLILAGSPALRRVILRPTRAVLEWRPYLPLLSRGFHIGIQTGFEVWVFNAVGFLMIGMGTLQMAGHQVAMNLASVSFMVPLGIGAAAATRVGNSIGRGDVAGAKNSAYVSLVIGAGCMVVSALAFSLLPRQLAGLYSQQESVIAMAATLLPVAGIFQLFDGAQAVGCGILRGAGDTKAAAYINFIGYWIIGLPVGVFLARKLDFGPAGLWWGLTIGLFAVAVMLIVRVHRKIGRATVLTRI